MRALLLLPILLTGCGEAVQDNHFAGDVRETRVEAEPVRTEALPVRIGELGPNFPACNGTGITRNVAAGQSLAVRAAPFGTAAESARIPAGSRFFICTRSHDQKWFGIVFEQEGTIGRCGVSAPVPAKGIYEGACGSGWVSSPFVKLVAGAEGVQQAAQ